MNRRNSIKLLVTAPSIFLVEKNWSVQSFGGVNSNEEGYIYFSAVNKNQLPVSENKRVPFSWKAFGLEPGKVYRFEINSENPELQGASWLRIAIAIDVREEKKVEARIAGKQTLLGVFDIRFSPVLHTYQIPLKQEYIKELIVHGLELELKEATQPLWIIEDTQAFQANQNIFKPHLYVAPTQSNDETDSFLQKLASLNSLQPFGWMEGCVLDALYQLYRHKSNQSALKAIQQHIDLFIKEDEFIHEDPRSRPHDNKISGIESTLPFAIIAQVLDKAHPIFDVVIEFWKNNLKEHGAVAHNMVSAEGSYTIAYPMAVLGVKRKNQDLIELAADQLLLRKDMLVHGGNNYLRYYPDTSKRTYKNWARGIAWYMLGMVRTMEVIEPHLDTGLLRAELKRTVSFALNHQNEEGLWPCFIDQPGITIDTSGSAGIAAVIASGVKLGYLDNQYEKFARKTWNGLQKYLTPDGLLTGVAQSNRNGEEFQASDYRVISQMGMGLMGQLYAYL